MPAARAGCGGRRGEGAEAHHGADVEGAYQSDHCVDERGPAEVGFGPGEIQDVRPDPVLAGHYPDGRPGELGGHPVIQPGDRPASTLVDQRLGVEGHHRHGGG
jgi:hypothetical protein